MRNGCFEQVVVEKADDKKKKRRSGRRSKHASSSSSVSLLTEIHVETPKCESNGKATDFVRQLALETCPPDENSTNTPNVTLDSLHSVCANGKSNLEDNRSSQDHNFSSSDPGAISVSNSCANIVTCQGASNSPMNKEIPPHHHLDGYAQPEYFSLHWSMDAINNALEKGDVFKACFRVNAHNRIEAYCKIDGVPTDILINGIQIQNRAVEGDVVAVKVDPLPMWTKMKSYIVSGTSSIPEEGFTLSSECSEMTSTSCKGKFKVNDSDENENLYKELLCQKSTLIDGHTRSEPNRSSNLDQNDGYRSSDLDCSQVGSLDGPNYATNAIERLCGMISSAPSKRPTGRVLAVIEKSPRREAVVGFLNVKISAKKDAMKNKGVLACGEFIHLRPNDPRYPKMMVHVQGLPDSIKRRWKYGDETLETELIGAKIVNWVEESPLPQASIICTFGQGGELEAQIHAILFENLIRSSDFSPESLASLPHLLWELPHEELQNRRDLRNSCIFTIDPSTASDLDDAISVERLSDLVFRVGIHVADVSYFVLPGTELDKEARTRSTSVYMSRSKLPMLPPTLSENVGSLSAGVDRLAFSMFLDINLAGDVVSRLIERTVIRSCCKLSYEQAQEIIDGSSGSSTALHGQFEWLDVVNSVKHLHELSKILREKRFKDGALSLDSPDIGFLFDECGNPYDSILLERKASNFLVEEFMLLANRTAAEVISRAFPDSALLRRHPQPNPRKLREFESFCKKHGLELDTSSSGQFHVSLQKISRKLQHDSTFLDTLISYASRSMQMATYFCTGDFKDSEKSWGHYGLGVSLYTHFTSPLRRYPDIVVHRTLAAVLEAEKMFNLKHERALSNCFTGIEFKKDIAESPEGREALLAAAAKHSVLGTESLSEFAIDCNDRKLASRLVNDACNKLYMWALLKSKKGLFSEARVVNLGPRFMTIYIKKFAIERRINYDEVEGLIAEWLEATSTLVLNFYPNRRSVLRGIPGKWRLVEEVALIVSPCDPILETNLEPLVFPLTIKVLSTIPVALHAIGGDNGPVDIGAKLFMSSFFY